MSPSATPAANSRDHNGVNWDPSALPEPIQCHKRHACHAKWRSMSPSATPATQSEGRCHQVPRLHTRGDNGVNWHPSQSSAIRATPATQSGGRCRQVPRLSRKVTIDVAQSEGRCHLSATPATAAATTASIGTQARRPSQSSSISATPATQVVCVCE